MARTNISVDQVAFEEFSSQAARQNKTLFAFSNETLSAVSKICAEGGSPEQLYPLWRSIAILRQIDVITLPSDFVDELVEGVYLQDKEGVLRMFSNLGSSLVGLLKIAAGDLDALSELAKDFTSLLPIKQFKIRKLDDEQLNKIELIVVGAGRRISSTECAFEFLKAVLNGYSYTVTNREISVGTLKVLASKHATF